MIHIKKCKVCGEPFDITTNLDLCPTCRKNEVTNERTRNNRNDL